MPDPFYTWYAGTLRDGLITHQLPMVSTSWSQVMDDAGSLSGSLPLADPDVAALGPRVATEPCRCFLAVAYTDSQGTETFLEAGPIWTHNYDTASRALVVGAAGLWSYYDHRKVLPVLAAGVSPSKQTVTYTAALGTIAKQLLQLAHTHTGGAVPVVFPDDEAGTETRTIHGYEMAGVGDTMRSLTQAADGPEIRFVPRRRADDVRFLEWVMRVGTAAAPLLTQQGVDWIFDASTEQTAVGNISVTRDGSSMADRWWVQGAGTETSTMFARADATDLIDAGFPLLEQTDSQHSGEDAAKRWETIDGYAAADLAASRAPQETWTLTVQRDGVRDDTGKWVGPDVSSWSVGDWVSITPPADDPYLPGDTYRTRITGLGGDDSTGVTVSLAPSIGGA